MANVPSYAELLGNSTGRQSSSSVISNKGTSTSSSLTEGTRVVLATSGLSGVVRFSGDTEFAPGVWVGVELDSTQGKNDGSVKGRRYFTCAPNKGLFIRPSSLLPEPKRRISPSSKSASPTKKAPHHTTPVYTRQHAHTTTSHPEKNNIHKAPSSSYSARVTKKTTNPSKSPPRHHGSDSVKKTTTSSKPSKSPPPTKKAVQHQSAGKHTRPTQQHHEQVPRPVTRPVQKTDSKASTTHRRSNDEVKQHHTPVVRPTPVNGSAKPPVPPMSRDRPMAHPAHLRASFDSASIPSSLLTRRDEPRRRTTSSFAMDVINDIPGEESIDAESFTSFTPTAFPAPPSVHQNGNHEESHQDARNSSRRRTFTLMSSIDDVLATMTGDERADPLRSSFAPGASVNNARASRMSALDFTRGDSSEIEETFAENLVEMVIQSPLLTEYVRMQAEEFLSSQARSLKGPEDASGVSKEELAKQIETLQAELQQERSENETRNKAQDAVLEQLSAKSKALDEALEGRLKSLETHIKLPLQTMTTKLDDLESKFTKLNDLQSALAGTSRASTELLQAPLATIRTIKALAKEAHEALEINSRALA